MDPTTAETASSLFDLKEVLLALVDAGGAGVVAVALLLHGWLSQRAEGKRHAELLNVITKSLETERVAHHREIELILAAHDVASQRVGRLLRVQSRVLKRLVEQGANDQPRKPEQKSSAKDTP